jgi:hypothetical protein
LFLADKGFFHAAYRPDEEKVLAYRNKAYGIYQKISGSEVEKLRVLSEIIHSKTHRGELESAEKHLQEGLSLFKESFSKIAKAHFLIVWSLLLMWQGKLDDVIDLIEKHASLIEDLSLYPTMVIGNLIKRVEAYAKKGEKALCEADLSLASKKINTFLVIDR